jgi:hypothetical protein
MILYPVRTDHALTLREAVNFSPWRPGAGTSKGAPHKPQTRSSQATASRQSPISINRCSSSIAPSILRCHESSRMSCRSSYF